MGGKLNVQGERSDCWTPGCIGWPTYQQDQICVYNQTFEDWMMAIGGEEGVEQDHFLLEDKELVVGGHNFHIRIPTHVVWAGIGDNISLECILGTGELSKHLRGVSKCCWWLRVRLCGGTELDFLFLTFHWDQKKPTRCAHVPE